MNMRVLQAMAGAKMGGAEGFFERLVLALHRAGVDQRVLIRRNPKRYAMLREAGVEVNELKFGGALDFGSRLGFRREIKDYHPDIVLTWMNRASSFCPRGDFIHIGRLGGYYDLKYYKNCDHLACNTLDILRWVIQQGWPADRAHYLPNFVSAEKAEKLDRAQFDTPEDAKLILGLGRLHVNKAFDVLLRAVERLPNTYLWLAGEGPLRSELESLAARLGIAERVRFLGWRDDAAALYASADVFVCPSRHEPLGNVVIEAWAQGAPVVACASQGPAQLIRDRENGLLTPLEEHEALAAAIQCVLDDPVLARGIAKAGNYDYRSLFTEDAVVRAYLDFFAKVIALGKQKRAA